jgi:hypothetical protein
VLEVSSQESESLSGITVLTSCLKKMAEADVNYPKKMLLPE